MSADLIDALLRAPAFTTAGPVETAFVAAVNACLEPLCRRFPRYARFVRERMAVQDLPLTTLGQVRALPALFLPVLKTYRFEVPDDLRVRVRLTSSGTTGVPSEVPLDEPNMQRRVAAMMAGYRGLGVFAGAVQALGFLLDPSTTQMAGSVVIDAVLRSAAEGRSIKYLARQGSAGPDFSLPEAVLAIKEAIREGPVLLVGYPALMAAAVQGLVRSGIARLPLPEGSFILTGGGWKAFLPGVRLDRQEFQQMMAGFFGVPPGSVRDMFGLSECPAVFVQCARGGYHVPAFAWAQAIDPETGTEVPAGQVGLLQLTVPLTTSYPLLKILTTDKVSLTCQCPCGLAAPVLTPHGRAAAARFETCAMKVGRALA
jgi:hypothetical protein